jgi:hypothetical protein
VTFETEVEDLKLANAARLLALIAEDDLKAKRKGMSRADKRRLQARRLGCLLLYLVMQSVSWWGIIYLTTKSKELDEAIKGMLNAPNLPIAIVPLIVTVINSVVPFFIGIIVNLAHFDNEGDVTKKLVFGVFFAKAFNAIIQGLSFVLLANPHIFSLGGNWSPLGIDLGVSYLQIRQSAAKQYEPSTFKCRANQVGNGLFTLYVTDFVVSKIIFVGVTFATWAVARCRKQRVKYAEFSVAGQMISLLYVQLLYVMSIPFFLTTGVFGGIFFYLSFKWESFMLRRGFYAKPTKSWAAEDAGAFFIKFYLGVQILMGLFSYLMLHSASMPKACPFQHDFPASTASFEAPADLSDAEASQYLGRK